MYIGDFTGAETITLPFNTFDSNGASITLTGQFITGIEVYKDQSMTQRASDAGYTLLDTDGIDIDTTTGIHAISIDLSDDTDAGFYSAGSDYFVVINGLTIDTQSVSFIVARFSIQNRAPYTRPSTGPIPALGIVESGTAQSATSTTCVLRAATAISDDVLNGATLLIYSTGQAFWQSRIINDWTSSTDTATVDAWTVTPTGTITYLVLATPPASLAEPLPVNVTQVGGATQDIATATALATVDTNVDDIKAVTDLLPNAGALSDLATAAALATVDANVDAILVDTGATLPARLDGIEGATFDTATDSLEALRNRGDSAWTTGAGGTPPQLLQSTTIATLASQTSFTLTAGSTDNDAYLNAIAVITDQVTSTQKAFVSISDYIGGTLTVTLASAPAFTIAVGDTVEIIVAGSGGAGSAPTVEQIRTEIDSNSSQLAAIVADTNEIQTDWADGGRLDTILDARASQATADAIEADTQDLQGRTPAALVGGRMDANTSAINNSTTAAAALLAILNGAVSGTTQPGTLSTTQATTDLSEATDDHYIGRIITFTSGALAGQQTEITDSSGTNGLLTFTALTEAPAAGVTFIIT